MAPTAPVLLWLRRELRLGDNAALTAAVASGAPVIPVYILDLETPGPWALGGAQRWWLHGSLTRLGADLSAIGSKLVLRRGRIGEVLPALVRETGASAVHAGAPVEGWARDAVETLRPVLGADLHLHHTITLFPPDSIRTKTGGVYTVFTSFARACLAKGRPGSPLPPPKTLQPPAHAVASDKLASWELLPSDPDWTGGLRETWVPGEAQAKTRLAQFVGGALPGYHDTRNMPGIDGTSMLSPHLHFGELSALTAWTEAERAAPDTEGTTSWVNELLWREFSNQLLWNFRDLPEQPLRSAFAAMPVRKNRAELQAWQDGRTGVPIVDAAMRQLWRLGWMHNRMRMVTASFLIKHLLMPWQAGEAWFWDTLVCADLASNSASWQWVAGCGADAAPFFRVFNPVLQGQKFDPDGVYVRTYVPELAALPNRWIHEPWAAPADILKKAGVRLGDNYPRPIVDLAEGRDRALAAFRSLREAA